MRRIVQIGIIAVVTMTPLRSARAEGPTRVYVYAQQETPARSWIPISRDGTVVAKLKRGTFFAVNVAPGRHMLSDERGVPVFVDARSGEESFVRLYWHFEVDNPVISLLQVVPPSQARKEMMYLTYIDAGKILSKSVPKKDPREIPRTRLRRRSDTDDE